MNLEHAFHSLSVEEAFRAVSFIFGDIPEAIAIIIVILLNTVIGFWMEYRAQTSLESLKKMDKLTARVSRDGKVVQMDAEELVPGDVLHLEPGDLIPADARIIYSSELSVDEAPLTGESVPVDKETGKLEEDVGVTDRINMIYKGTAVTNGKARALVTGTGMQTEIGEISRMVSESEGEDIPLNKKLGRLARRLIYIIAGLSVLFFIFGWIAVKEIYLLLQTAIAWTVAAIPEGLPIVASISLARRMLRLSRQNVLVRKLSAVETLGETTLIMTDKTGTLTRNQLTLDELELTGKEKDGEAFTHFFNVAVLCNDASPDNGDWKGDPLDAALLEYGSEKQRDRFDELRNLDRINEDAFYRLGLSGEICNNIAFFGLAFGQLLHVFDMREADESLFNNQVTRNRYIWMALGFCTAILLAAYFIPVMRDVLSFRDLQPVSWGLIAAASILPLITNQLLKRIWKI